MTPLPDDFEVQDLNSIPIKKEEAKHQAALVAVLRKTWYGLSEEVRPIIFHIPMGGSRDAREGANLKTQGALAGVPDLCLVLPQGRIIWIEMKAEDGSLSKVQIDLHASFALLGQTVIVAYSVFDALDKLREVLNG